MAVYTIQAPDGRKIRIEAADAQTAMRGAQEWAAANPVAAPVAGKRVPAVKPKGDGSFKKPFDLSGGQSRAAIPLGSYYRDPEGNIRRNDNGDRGNPIIQAGGKRRTPMQEVTGALANVNRGLLIGDELAAGVGTAADVLTGRVRAPMAPGMMGAALGRAYQDRLQQQRATEDDFSARRPKAAALARGVGMVPTVLVPGGQMTASTRLGVVGEAALSGAAQGAASGLLDRGSMQERIRAGQVGAAVGGGVGGAAGAAIAGVGRGAKPKAPAIPGVDPKVAKRALDYVRKQGAIPDEALTGTAPLTAAEAMGRRGQTALGALARQEGETADALQGLVAARRADRPGRILGAMEQTAGVAPDAAHGQINALVSAGQRRAKPLYDEAFSNQEPMYSPTIERLLARPVTKRAVGRAREAMRNSDLNPDALGLSFADDMGEWASTPSGFTDPVAPTVPRAPSRAPSQGDDLMTFLSKQGGLRDDGGELAARDATIWHQAQPFRRRLVNPQGLSLEEAAQRAYDAGYFPDVAPPSMEGGGNMQAVSGDDLLKAIEAELRGNRRFARAADQGALDRMRMADEADWYAAQGPDFEGSYTGRPEPVGSPVYEAQPTTQSLDYVVRGLDDEIDALRDPVTRAFKDPGRARDLISTRSALRSEMFRLAEEGNRNPAYVSAVREAGDYLSAEGAFNRVRDSVFSSRVPVDVFASQVRKLGPAELKAAKAGAANALFRLEQAGRLRAGALQVPHIEGKLRALFGDDAVAGLQQSFKAEDAMQAFENRYAPGAGSITAEMDAAMGEQGDAFGDLLGFGADAVQYGVKRGFMNQVGKQVQGLADRARTSWSVPMRDAAGKVLMMSPAEAKAILEASQPNGLVASLLSEISGGGAGSQQARTALADLAANDPAVARMLQAVPRAAGASGAIANPPRRVPAVR